MGGTDLFTSARGPGLIGTVLALIVVGGFGLLYLFVFDKSLQGEGRTIEDVIRDQTSSIEGLQSQIASAEKRIDEGQVRRKQLSDLKLETGRSENLARTIATRTGARDRAADAIAGTASNFDDYRNRYRQAERARAKDEEIPDFETSDGLAFSNVRILSVDAIGMQVRHDGGIKRIPQEKLPAELRDRFQFDEDESQLAREKEADQHVAYSGKVDIANLTKRIKQIDYQIGEREDDIAKLEAKIDSAKANLKPTERRIQQLKSELAADRQRAAGRAASGRQGISRAPQIREQLQTEENRLAAIRSGIPAAQAMIADDRAEIRRMRSEIESIRADIRNRREELESGDD